MGKTINGFMLIDAPWSALNNAGMDAGERTDNAVKVKVVRKGRDVYPYVSGQAVRYWWRDTLAKKFAWNLSPIERVAKVAYTSANPIEYDDDDMFGYMRAAKEEIEGTGKKVNVTVTRISPLKNSPLLSVYPQNPTDDFGVMARQSEGDPVPYEHQFYSTIFKGIFSIDIEMAGRFYEIEKTGYKNMSPKLIEKAKERDLKYDENERFREMPVNIRRKRIKETILALPYLSGGAKLTEHLTDVSPKFLILAVIEGGNHIFMNVADENGINFDALSQVIEDYKEIILSDIYIGKREGFLDEMSKKITEFANRKWNYNGREIQVKQNSINNTVVEFAKNLDIFIV
ncbi:MAG: type I-B CRISPR-associated protein Cas7/Cst2/DevR [Desulfurellaceae bacterium]|nr:type I-B CRISPR-associated protein Cas7/Cst2/DevR [Desulfurellaceae bacterium]